MFKSKKDGGVPPNIQLLLDEMKFWKDEATSASKSGSVEIYKQACDCYKSALCHYVNFYGL